MSKSCQKKKTLKLNILHVCHTNMYVGRYPIRNKHNTEQVIDMTYPDFIVGEASCCCWEETIYM